ncbi:MAG: DUF1552 domain-containing protein [Planctomycetia bacterium]|nr:DUF1552 domain-containing protein [Planctomycetia bacterium]
MTPVGLKTISRRTVLRGLGTAMALPLLDAMLPSLALAAPAAKKALPKRMAFLFVPNGIHMQDWTPKNEGKDFDLPPTLEPLADVKDEIVVLSGLAHDKARANGDGPGDHARSAATFLTGCQARKTHGADIKVGISVDQIAASKIGHETALPSLELGIDRGANAGNCDSGYSCAYSANISWKSPSTPNAKEVDPRLVFERLFGGGSGDERDQAKKKRNEYRKSILDLVMEDAKRLQAKVGTADQRKLDEYLTSVREIEARIQNAERRPAAPPADPDFKKPGGVPRELTDHVRLMYDLLALAFQGDVTRIATFMCANEGSNKSYPSLEVPEGHHDLSHHGGDKAKQAKIAKINRYYVEQLAYFLKKMRSIEEEGQPLLDRSMVLYGGAIGDGNAHNHDNLPLVLAGSAGGTYATGRHVRWSRETPVANLFLTMLDIMQAPVNSFGDSNGDLAELTR